MRRQHKILVTTKLGRPDAARVAVKLEEAHDGAYADPALLGSFRYRSAGINRLDHARSQVLRIRLRHPCWPPPAGSLNQIRCGVKIPDSAFSGNALGGKGAGAARRVNAAGTHLLSLINEILDLSKIEAGKLELNPERVDLARLIDEVIGTAGQLAEKNKNRLVVEAEENLGPLTTDPMRLK